MKKQLSKLVIATLMSHTMLSATVLADDSVTHSGKASKHSALASTHSLKTTATVGSAVVAAPIIITGASVLATGSVVEDSLNDSKRRQVHVHHHHHQTLEVTDTIITVDPAPNKAVKNTH